MNTKERRKHGCDGCHYKRATEKFEGYCGNNIWLCDKCLNKLVKNGLQEDKWISVEKKYNELIMAVESKYPNETRYETALRYIKQAEMPRSYTGNAKPPITNKPKKRGGCNQLGGK